MQGEIEQIWEVYESFKHKALVNRRFKHSHLQELLLQYPFEKDNLGKSSQGREINLYKWGKGSTKILLWSQMHGDEATATMALLDIFNFLSAEDFGEFKANLAANITLYFIPMLNPDGAEQFIRRTAQGIDMNRDALAQVSPESKILAKIQHILKPEFSFNLHDQNVRYAAGNTPNQAGIAFLATAYDEATSWNHTRTRAAKVIVGLNQFLQKIIPNKVGRFSDEFEPRAFGDNIQKWGSSLILVESGGNGDDREKMFLRKLNFILLLKAFQMISHQDYEDYSIDEYQSIPQNEKCLFDFLIRDIEIETEEGFVKGDIGINLTENNINKATNYVLESVIEDMGDLSVFYGIKELNGTGMKAVSFDKYPSLAKRHKVQLEEYACIQFEKKAYFVIENNGKPIYIIVNGILIDC